MTVEIAQTYLQSMFKLRWISEHADPRKLKRAPKVQAAISLYWRLHNPLPSVDIEDRTWWMTRGQVGFLVKRGIFSSLTGDPDYRLSAVSPAFALASRYNPQREDTPLSVFVLCENAGCHNQLHSGMKVLALRADQPIPGPRTGYKPNWIYLFGVFRPHEVDKLLDPSLIISSVTNPQP